MILLIPRYYHMFKEMFTGGALVEEFTMPSLDRVRMLYMYVDSYRGPCLPTSRHRTPLKLTKL